MANKKEQFVHDIQTGYSFDGTSIDIGAAILDNEIVAEAKIRLPLRMMNRHGLIAGATGSGKTKTLQMLAEQLSANSIPVLMMDIKGDLSGIATPGVENDKIKERANKIGISFHPNAAPVEFYTLSNKGKGARLRATVTEFGPILLSKILGLNDTQQGIIAVVFKYCDNKALPLIDLKDFVKVLQYISSDEGKEEIKADYGMISSSTIGTIMRKVVELQQQGADTFFGSPSFEVKDLCRIDDNGKGIVSIIRLADIQDRPKLFSSFMLQLLAEIYATFPEKGDADQPELVIFIDEAHLVFQEASATLLEQIETIIKLIRSKGIGVYFVTQNPTDIPNSVLGQLGLKIQHALRAFTAKDRKDIKLVAQNYPESNYYDVENLLTQLGIGEALITSLNEKGIPTLLAHTMLRAPESRMDVLTEAELDDIISISKIEKKYNQDIDIESAYEILTKKIEAAKTTIVENKAEQAKNNEPTVLEKALDNPLVKQVGRTVMREVTRGLLGALGLGGGKGKSWF